MGRLERRLFALADRLTRIDEQIRLAQAELEVQLHLEDDTRRDAALGGRLEREELARTEREIAGLRSAITAMERDRDRLGEDRQRLLSKLGSDS